MLYVGVDAHKSTSQVTVMAANGNILRRKRIASSPDAVREVLSLYEEPVNPVLEASYAWAPMYDWLDEVADEVILAHPLKVRAIAEARIKTDKIHSETLAHLLRADLIPEAHAPPKDVRARKRAAASDVSHTAANYGEEPHPSATGSARDRTTEDE